jgi:hypothetical protein
MTHHTGGDDTILEIPYTTRHGHSSTDRGFSPLLLLDWRYLFRRLEFEVEMAFFLWSLDSFPQRFIRLSTHIKSPHSPSIVIVIRRARVFGIGLYRAPPFIRRSKLFRKDSGKYRRPRCGWTSTLGRFRSAKSTLLVGWRHCKSG